MTLDLDAIRARDAEFTDDTPRWQTLNGDGWEAVTDRRALLAEVDRLTADLVASLDAAQNDQRTGAAAERARIRAAVEGLRTWTDAYPPRVMVVDRAAVLAAIDGETP